MLYMESDWEIFKAMHFVMVFFRAIWGEYWIMNFASELSHVVV